MTPLILLDSIETCLSLEPLRVSMFRLGLGDSHLELWFARALRDAFAREVTGEFVSFSTVLIDALEAMLVARGSPSERDECEAIVDDFAELPPYPDVRPALERARARGIRVAILTNGGEKATRKAFDRANLADLIERFISVDEIEHYKPSREVYLHAARVLGVRPQHCVLVAAHAWDVRGALSAGLGTAFVQRHEAITADLANELVASRRSLEALFADLEQVTEIRHSA
jgi:2-haloacid dehalogenase